MSLCVIPIGSGDSGVHMDTSCQSNQEEHAKKHGKAGDIMENTDLEDSTVGWDMDSLLYYDLPTQVKKVSEYMRDEPGDSNSSAILWSVSVTAIVAWQCFSRNMLYLFFTQFKNK